MADVANEDTKAATGTQVALWTARNVTAAEHAPIATAEAASDRSIPLIMVLLSPKKDGCIHAAVFLNTEKIFFLSINNECVFCGQFHVVFCLDMSHNLFMIPLILIVLLLFLLSPCPNHYTD